MKTPYAGELGDTYTVKTVVFPKRLNILKTLFRQGLVNMWNVSKTCFFKRFRYASKTFYLKHQICFLSRHGLKTQNDVYNKTFLYRNVFFISTWNIDLYRSIYMIKIYMEHIYTIYFLRRICIKSIKQVRLISIINPGHRWQQIARYVNINTGKSDEQSGDVLVSDDVRHWVGERWTFQRWTGDVQMMSRRCTQVQVTYNGSSDVVRWTTCDVQATTQGDIHQNRWSEIGATKKNLL